MFVDRKWSSSVLCVDSEKALCTSTQVFNSQWSIHICITFLYMWYECLYNVQVFKLGKLKLCLIFFRCCCSLVAVYLCMSIGVSFGLHVPGIIVVFWHLFVTYCQIVHWRNHLKFPEEANLTLEAKDLICRLLCDVEHRLGTGGADQIKVRCKSILPLQFCQNFHLVHIMRIFQAHPWFKDIEWDKLYEMEAAYKPEVNGELDTQNFMKFDEVLFTAHPLSFLYSFKWCTTLCFIRL